MFQFPAFAYLTVWYIFNVPGCPIRTSADLRLFAPTRSFSQLITSFIASESPGIHHTPLFIYSNFSTNLAFSRDSTFYMFISSYLLIIVLWNLFPLTFSMSKNFECTAIFIAVCDRLKGIEPFRAPRTCCLKRCFQQVLFNN